jgi:peptidoglycan/LPS O-acetylase OafA/YrhL
MFRHATTSSDRDNNFNLLRMVAATAVLVSHAYPLALGANATEPLTYFLGMTLGTLAVCSFFAISGYFILQSFDRKRDLTEFTAARILRIYPGLFAALFLTVFVLGPIFTEVSVGAYFSHPETLLYIPRNLSLIALQYELPGVFGANPYAGAINGSLWTLVYEVACYAMVAGVGLCGIASNTSRFAVFLIAYCGIYLILSVLELHSSRLDVAQQLSLPFVIGMSLFYFREYLRLRLDLLIAVIGVTFFSYGLPWFSQVFMFAWCYVLLYIGFAKVRPLLVYNRLGDYSYGMYIYAFPVQQVVVVISKGCTPLELMTWAFVPTLGLAVLSWHLIEKRSTAQRAAVTLFLKRARTLPT